jgi:hypothetical protein
VRNLERRLKLVEKKMQSPDRLVAILPDWLASALPSDAHPPKKGERVIKPSGFLAIQPDGSVKYES